MVTSAFLILNGVLYVALGIWCLLSPASVSEMLGYKLSTDGAFAEFQAVYGGLELGFGVFLLFAIFFPQHSEAALWSLAFIYGGLVLGRLKSIAFYSPAIGSGWNFLALEAVFFIAAVALLRFSGR